MARVKFEPNGYPNYTEKEVGDIIYWRGSERERTIYCGQVVGIWVDRMWVVRCYCSIRLGPFQEWGRRAEPVTITQWAVWDADKWLDKIPAPFPHEQYMEMRPVIPADFA
jgi:hypothetical protein